MPAVVTEIGSDVGNTMSPLLSVVPLIVFVLGLPTSVVQFESEKSL